MFHSISLQMQLAFYPPNNCQHFRLTLQQGERGQQYLLSCFSFNRNLRKLCWQDSPFTWQWDHKNIWRHNSTFGRIITSYWFWVAACWWCDPVTNYLESMPRTKRTIFPLPLNVTPTSYPRYPHPNQHQDPNIPPLAHHSATITSYGKYVDKAG